MFKSISEQNLLSPLVLPLVWVGFSCVLAFFPRRIISFAARSAIAVLGFFLFSGLSDINFHQFLFSQNHSLSFKTGLISISLGAVLAVFCSLLAYVLEVFSSWLSQLMLGEQIKSDDGVRNLRAILFLLMLSLFFNSQLLFSWVSLVCEAAFKYQGSPGIESLVFKDQSDLFALLARVFKLSFIFILPYLVLHFIICLTVFLYQRYFSLGYSPGIFRVFRFCCLLLFLASNIYWTMGQLLVVGAR